MVGGACGLYDPVMKRSLSLLALLVFGQVLALAPAATAQQEAPAQPSQPATQPAAQPETATPGPFQPEAEPEQPKRNPKNTVDFAPRWGLWRGEIELPGSKELSFNFVIDFTRDENREPIWTVTLRNGSESLPAEMEVNYPQIIMTFPGTDARIEANSDRTDTSLSGEYIYTRSSDTGESVEYRLPFTAQCSDSRRFAWLDPAWKPGEPISNKWVVNFDERTGPAVAELRTLPDGMNVWGTVMTPTGDDGQLAGTFENGRLRLSRFTGGSGLLYDGTLEADGTLIGTYRSLAHHAEGFTASPDGEAALPDLFQLTKWKDKVDLADLTFRNFEGSEVNLADLAPDGSPRLVYVMGTWCHNCADATNFLSTLYEKYHDQGLTIVGLAFETPKAFEEQADNVRTYVLRKSVPFPILVAGQRNKDDATQTLGALDKVRAFPTIAFVDAQGKVVAVHQGFVGPAAPERHAELRHQFTERIESMLAGK